MNIRIISKKEVRQMVLYSPAHIDRLEKAGRFPKRVQVGPCRVGSISLGPSGRQALHQLSISLWLIVEQSILA